MLELLTPIEQNSQILFETLLLSARECFILGVSFLKKIYFISCCKALFLSAVILRSQATSCPQATQDFVLDEFPHIISLFSMDVKLITR